MTPTLHRSASRAVLAALLLLVGLATPLGASSEPSDETLAAQRRIEAVYLYKFSTYIGWPARAFRAPDSPLIIGVAGDNEMADELATIVADRPMNGHSVVVQHVRAGDSVQGIHILFVAAGMPGGDSLLEATRDNWTLGVTEGSGGLEYGADISFVLVNDHVRFDISLDATQRDGLKVSSQLLSVADKVIGTLKP